MNAARAIASGVFTAFATFLEAVLLQLLDTLFTQLVLLLVFLVVLRHTSRPWPNGRGRDQTRPAGLDVWAIREALTDYLTNY